MDFWSEWLPDAQIAFYRIVAYIDIIVNGNNLFWNN